MGNKLAYRPDIDGLRAVAVLAVIFYHAGSGLFSGGYIGVDVFFVISGFLITSKIYQNLEANKFSFLDFYERRIRRIFPALYVTLLFTLGFGAWVFDRLSFMKLGQSSTATALFSSNIYFWTQSGYFQDPSALRPLLHMWSLSVEEQFYFVLPLLLVVLYRYLRKHLRTALAAIAAVSLISVIFTLQRDPSAAFYLVQGRVWELLLGSLLALSRIGEQKPLQRNILSAAGLLMILASMVVYTDETIFPGTAALLPVVGSAAIIYSGTGGGSWVGKILSARPFVYLGKISYSLYLWHWPLLVFARYYLIRELGIVDILIWLALTFLISSLSWKFIETPFRSLAFLPKPRIFYLSGAVVLITAISGYLINAARGLPERFSADQELVGNESEWNAEEDIWRGCISEAGEPASFPRICPIGDESQAPEFFLWGDSHAGALYPALNLSATNAAAGGQYSWLNGCPPLVGIDRDNNQQGECVQYNQGILDHLAAHPELGRVILAARWAISADGSRYKTEEGSAVRLVDLDTPSNDQLSNPELFAIGLKRTIAELVKLKREIIIISSVPEIGYPVPSSSFIALRTGRDINDLIGPTVEEYQARNRDVISALDHIQDLYPEIKVIDPSAMLCDQEKCQVVLDQVPLYQDDDHLSTFGGWFIAPLFDPCFSP